MDCGHYLNTGFIQGKVFFKVCNKLCTFLILTCLPLVAVLRSPQINVHDITEKTKTFYCPSGNEFSTKSKDLQQQTKKVCILKSRCSWTMSNGCSGWENGSMGKWIMDRYFEVIIINLYSSEQKFNLWTISTKIYTIYHVCGYCECVQPYKHVCSIVCIPMAI